MMELYHFNPNHDRLGRFTKSSNSLSGNRSARDKLLRGIKDVDKKKMLDSTGSVNRFSSEVQSVYDKYVDTSSIGDRRKKLKIEQRLYDEGNPRSGSDYDYNTATALTRRLTKGEEFTKSYLKLLNTDKPSNSSKRLVSDRTTKRVLQSAGYENSKKGREYVYGIFETNYNWDKYRIG